MRVVAFNILGSGHVNPTLPIVRALVERGDEVTYFCYSERRDDIEHTGATFNDYGRPNFRVALFHPEGVFPTQLLPATAGLMPWLVEQVSPLSPDVIFTDVLAPWGTALGQALDVPVLGSCSSMMLTRSDLTAMLNKGGYQIDEVNRRALETLRTRWGVTFDGETLGFQPAPVNLVYSTAAFHPPLNQVSERIEFIGPLIEERRPDPSFPLETIAASDKRVVYISMGSILGKMLGLGQAFYQPLFDALGSRSDLLVVLSIGRGVDAKAISAPSNFQVHEFVPQLALLPHVDVFVSHCGMNSACEALFHGVPLLCLPNGNDQHLNARLAAEQGVGLVLDPEHLTSQEVAQAIDRLLADHSYRDGADRIRASFRSAGGVTRALEILDELATR